MKMPALLCASAVAVAALAGMAQTTRPGTPTTALAATTSTLNTTAPIRYRLNPKIANRARFCARKGGSISTDGSSVERARQEQIICAVPTWIASCHDRGICTTAWCGCMGGTLPYCCIGGTH